MARERGFDKPYGHREDHWDCYEAEHLPPPVLRGGINCSAMSGWEGEKETIMTAGNHVHNLACAVCKGLSSRVAQSPASAALACMICMPHTAMEVEKSYPSPRDRLRGRQMTAEMADVQSSIAKEDEQEGQEQRK